MIIRFKDKRKGYALIISVGILSMLVIIAIAFVINMRLELSAAGNYANSVKVKYLAEAAMNKAIAELKYGTDGAINNAVDDTTEAWYGTDPYSESSISLGDLTGSYTVTQIIDCASQININDDTNPNLNDMLTTLNTALGSPLTGADINQIVSNAPYETEEEILGSLSGNLSQRKTKYDAIKDHITIFNYIDPDTIDPQDVQDPPYETQPRSPVNVNTASREVLIAILSDIKVDNACPKCGGDGYINGAYAGHYGCTACGGSGQRATRIDGSGDLEITSTEAGNLADYIINNRPYRTWSQFYSLVRSCPSIGEKDADLVMANCNPDTGFSWIRNVAWHEDLGYIGKYVIDMDRNGSVSSSDKGLTTNSTEFTFNSGGYYEIYVEAQVEDSFSNIVAEKKLMATVKIFDIYRETTQTQFDAGTKTNIQSYPEPVQAGISSANYSGQLAISTLWHSLPANPPFPVHFRANYQTTLNADSSGGNSPPISDPGAPTLGSTASSSNRGELVPDGMLVTYLDLIRPKYWPLNNASEDEGTMIMWFKPRYPGNDTRNYQDTDQDRKMYRFTSNTDIFGNENTSGSVPYSTFFFWSDYQDLWSGALRGGGRWDGSNWSFIPSWGAGWWWGWTSSGFPNWERGEWQQLVWSWKNPDDELDPTQYNTTSNPICLYSNGNLLRTSTYYYHTPYSDASSNRAMYTGCEYDSWNGYQRELSSAVIGNVKVYPEKLTNAQIADSYFVDGVYETSGTFTSSTFNPSDVDDVEWATIIWTEAIPSVGGDLVFNFNAGSGWQGNFNSPSSGNPLSSTSDSIRYRANFSSSTNKDTPILGDVTITYLGPTEIKYWREIYE